MIWGRGRGAGRAVVERRTAQAGFEFVQAGFLAWEPAGARRGARRRMLRRAAAGPSVRDTVRAPAAQGPERGGRRARQSGAPARGGSAPLFKLAPRDRPPPRRAPCSCRRVCARAGRRARRPQT